MRRWIGFVFLVLLLLLTGYVGLRDGLTGTHEALGAGQWATTTTQLLYGVFAILTLTSMGARLRIATRFLYGWCIATTLTSGLAPVVYGGATLIVGAAGGVAGAIIAIIVLWLWKNRPDGVHG